MSESYSGRQIVGVDLHRRRSVLVRMTESGECLETVRIANDIDRLGWVMARAGESPEVVLEATYGWYWAADALAGLGASVHLAHPLGVKMFSHRRVKNDELDARDLADLLRMGRLPEAWIAPPATRELPELVRHRAKLVGLRWQCQAQVHAVLAKCGVAVSMTDLFGLEGNRLLDEVELAGRFRARIDSLRRVIEGLEFEIEVFGNRARRRLAGDPGYTAIGQIPGIGAVLAAVFVAEIGDVTRFPPAGAAGRLGRIDPAAPRVGHHRAPRPDHQAGLSAGAVGGGGVGADAAKEQPHRRGPRAGRLPPRPQHRGAGRRAPATRAGLLPAARPHGARPAAPRRGMTSTAPVGAGRAGHNPLHRRGRSL